MLSLGLPLFGGIAIHVLPNVDGLYYAYIMFLHNGHAKIAYRLHVDDTVVYTKSDSTRESIKLWAESDVCDRNATVFFQKA